MNKMEEKTHNGIRVTYAEDRPEIQEVIKVHYYIEQNQYVIEQTTARDSNLLFLDSFEMEKIVEAYKKIKRGYK